MLPLQLSREARRLNAKQLKTLYEKDPLNFCCTHCNKQCSKRAQNGQA